MTSQLLIVGSVALDTVETRAGKREDILGGAATYISLAASHFAPAGLVAVVGAGFIGPVHVEALRRLGIQVTGILGVDQMLSHDREPGIIRYAPSVEVEELDWTLSGQVDRSRRRARR